MENTMAANTAAAESANTAPAAAEGSAAASENTSAAAVAEQDVTRTQAFSQRLNQMSAQRTDAAIKALGMVNHYDNSPIETIDQLQAYNAMRQADEAGDDPRSAAAMVNLQSQLSQQNAQLAEYRLREQEAAITADPVLSQLYNEYRDEAIDYLELLVQNGGEANLGTALNMALTEHLGDIRAREYERGKSEALASINANRAASPGSVGGVPAGGRMDWSTMSDEEFEKQLEVAKSGGYRKT